MAKNGNIVTDIIKPSKTNIPTLSPFEREKYDLYKFLSVFFIKKMSI
jgi:hypothetical protein